MRDGYGRADIEVLIAIQPNHRKEPRLMNTTVARVFTAIAVLWGAAPAMPAVGAVELSPLEGNVESSAHPEVQRLYPIERDARPKPVERTSQPARSSLLAPQSTAAAQALGPNLIANPSVETAGSPGLPAQWNKGGYGTNARTLTYPVTGFNSPSGLQVTISSYTSGDAKWYFNEVAVTAGATYQFSDFYHANIPSILTAQFRMSNGSFTYRDLGTLSPAGAYTNATVQFVVPANAVSVTIFHLIKQVGYLITDEFSLNDVTQQTDDGNLVPNPELENGSSGQPISWNKGRWGTNAAVFSYPVTGMDNSKAAKVAMTSYTSGDAKWYFAPVSIARGTYTFSTAYKANAATFAAAQLHRSDGSLSYSDTTSVPASSVFATYTRDVWIPMGVNAMTMFHVLRAIGELATDHVSLRLKSPPTGVFTTGAVSLTFDDGWLSQYQNAVPKLNATGLKATFYIITRQMADDGFPGYMSKAQVTTLFHQGHEIGAHTRTHRALTSLSASEQQAEIQGSRQDLLAMNVGPIPAFAYPFGDYNGTTLQLVHDANFTSARSTINGVIIPTWDDYQLPRFSMEITTTFAQVKQAIDTSIANKEWLALVFHKVDTGSDRYTMSPELFNQVIDYLVQQGILVVTVSQGMPSMQ